jgi:hypothetical protein
LAHYLKLVSKEKKQYAFSSPTGDIELVLPSNLDSYWDDYESEFVSDLENELSESDVFYDIGAYVGYITKVAIKSEVSPSNIHSFEGIPYRYYVLQQNCGPLGVNTTNKYVGMENSRVQIAIDDYCQSNPAPDIAKIDVEGHEYEVLKGMSSTITNSKPTLYVEIHPELLQNFGYDESQTLELLEDFGYELMYMRHRNGDALWEDEPVYDESTESPTYMLKATV